MKVKIGNKIYDSEKEPIMLILSDCDKKNISNMHPEADRYASYPEGSNSGKINVWMCNVDESCGEAGELKSKDPLKNCQSGSDGECNDPMCPQKADNEPQKTGRSCPIYNWDDDRV